MLVFVLLKRADAAERFQSTGATSRKFKRSKKKLTITTNAAGVRMSLKRTIKRKQELAAKKEAKKKTQSALNELASMPDKCSTCADAFDIKNDFHLDNWTINISDAGIQMLCDKCNLDAKDV